MKSLRSYAERWLTLARCAGLVVLTLSTRSLASEAGHLSALIDAQLDARLEAEGITISAAAEDAEFLRRLYLDITGRLPTPSEVRDFLADKAPDRRSAQVEQLLAHSQYGEHMADIWDSLLVKRNSDNRRVPVRPLNRWLANAFNTNRPWNEVAFDLLTAEGPQRHNPAVTPFLADKKAVGPHEATDLVARVFLGVRLECAQCHNHPYARWTHADYWGVAAFFNNVTFTKKFGPNLPTLTWSTDNYKERGTAYGILESSKRKKKPMLPDRALVVAPRFLDGQVAVVSQQMPLRPALAHWIATPDNPWFAKAIVNRIWAQFFGRGLVHPVDDLREDNEASHPELFDAVVRDFVAQDFDLKYLIEGICQSKAYQRTSRPAGNNSSDSALYSHMAIKVLSPEQLFDHLLALLGPEAIDRKRRIDRERLRFVQFFQTQAEPEPRQYDRGIPHTLKLLNNSGYYRAMEERITEIEAEHPSSADVIDQCYLLTLSRLPSQDERDLMVEFAAADDRGLTSGHARILWILLNSSEFAVNH